MNFAKTFLLLLVAAVAAPVFGANLYIHYDAQCMNRLEYVDMGTGQPAGYVTYQIRINDNEMLVLEVGQESQRYQNYLPTNATNCGNAIYSREIADNINQQIDQAFIVYQKGRNQYFVSPVSFAAYFIHSDQKISYSSPQYQFDLNLQQGIIGENIALNRQRAEVFFDGKLENQCSGAYVFRQFSLYTSSPHMDIIIVPEVGVVEVRNGRNAEDALQHIRRLEKVNGQYLNDYMDRVCLGILPETTVGSQSSIYQPQPDAQTLPRESDDLQARTPGAVVPPKKHTVQKSETLFSIAKANKVALADLRKWNKLEKSNLIRPGDVLWLGPPVSEQALKSAQTNSKGAVDTPAPYDIPGVEQFAWGEPETPATEQGTSYWKTYPSEYVVQPGETVASIARKFGYTEARFREMNNLGATAEVKINQRLRTSDCAPGAQRPSDYDLYSESGATGGDETPPYESKIIPTAAYYQSAGAVQPRTGQPDAAPRRTAGRPTDFDPYSSNTPSFYESPEANRIRTAPGSSFSLSRPQTAAGVPSEYGATAGAAPVNYDQSTLPQSYDQIGQSPAAPRANRTLHFVKEGETLYDIARSYGTTPERLRELNQIGPGETIMPFQQIYVN